MLRIMRRITVALALAALMVVTALPAMAQPDHATGLERAREVAAQGVETAAGLTNPQNADRATGLERAAEAIAAARDRGNGNGHAWGRGNAQAVQDIKANGGSPSDRPNHGQAVREMVQTYNALRKGA